VVKFGGDGGNKNDNSPDFLCGAGGAPDAGASGVLAARHSGPAS